MMRDLFCVAALAGCMSMTGTQASELARAITDGDIGLHLRYRLELVDDDAFREDAEASTLLLRLNYQTAEYRGWSGKLEFDHVAEIGLDDFNSGGGTSPGRTQFPVVADPDGSDLNQLWLQYAFNDQVKLRFGRQRILLDNQRFVGGVGWRQNEQTYDAARLDFPIGSGAASYVYVAHVNRIFGDEVSAGDHDHDTHLLHGDWPLGSGRLTGYAYLIDSDDAPGFSTDTFGLRWTNQAQVGDWPLDYLAEYAHQSDAANNPANYDADYLRLEGTLGFTPVKLGLGFERLGSGDAPGAAFVTPLATLHAFNGWADRFLATPERGLDDIFLTAAGKLGPYAWNVVFHDFETEEGGVDLGHELDASLSRKFGSDDRYALLVKVAAFDGDDGPPDTSKFWVMLSADF